MARIENRYKFSFRNDLLKSPLRPPFFKGGNGGISGDASLKKKMFRNMGAY
jgi:hypothetical protein